jgi:hypothetical protein
MRLSTGSTAAAFARFGVNDRRLGSGDSCEFSGISIGKVFSEILPNSQVPSANGESGARRRVR